VGLSDKLKNVPSQLSGGEQQRVSIARALAGRPSVILADEPTGALDTKTGRDVLRLLQELHREGNTIVLITHDNSIASTAPRIIRLSDGKVVFDGPAYEGSLDSSGRGGCGTVNFFQAFRLAVQSILSSKVRAFLTMLGIIIGVGAVTLIVGMGNGMQNYIEDAFTSMGTNLINVDIMGRGTSRSVDVDDLYELVENNRCARLMSRLSLTWGYVKIGSDEPESSIVNRASAKITYAIRSYSMKEDGFCST
jgi:energy-coupling factor transporter ATP-binding protein EcfA2